MSEVSKDSDEEFLSAFEQGILNEVKRYNEAEKDNKKSEKDNKMIYAQPISRYSAEVTLTTDLYELPKYDRPVSERLKQR